MKRAELEEAAFWDRKVCVACEAVFDAEDATDEGCCPECGSGEVVPASSGLKLVDLLEESEE